MPQLIIINKKYHLDFSKNNKKKSFKNTKMLKKIKNLDNLILIKGI